MYVHVYMEKKIFKNKSLFNGYIPFVIVRIKKIQKQWNKIKDINIYVIHVGLYDNQHKTG